MRPLYVFLATASILSLVLASCTMPTSVGAGPRTWIDEPLDGSTLPLAPVIVRSHAASDSGTTSATLLVNGARVRTDNTIDQSNPLVEIPQVWKPELPGDYILQVVAMDGQRNEGSSNAIRVRIGSEVTNPVPNQGGRSPEPPATAETRLAAPIMQPPAVTSAPAPACQVPTFTFSMNANCREGPGTAYEVDRSFLPGQSAQIDGRNAADPRWWWVSSSGAGHCWVSGSTGSSSCVIADVPIIAVPPLPVAIPPTNTSAPPPPPPPSKPTAPANFSVTNKTCDSSSYVVGLNWTDSSGEDGYRVYRDGAVIATLPANATSYAEPSPNYSGHNYFVQAYNSAGFANGPILSSTGCVF